MPHVRDGTLAIMGFAGNMSEQKVIASPKGCAKQRNILISKRNFPWLSHGREVGF
jgi:hypothetical protein